jgi:hypothetical protein
MLTKLDKKIGMLKKINTFDIENPPAGCDGGST